MSRRGREGKKQWQQGHSTLPEELRQQIQGQSAERLAQWELKGHLPAWIRFKWFLQRRDTRTGVRRTS